MSVKQVNQEIKTKSGVKTEEGKRIVRHNSFKHGLCSKGIISNLESFSESLDQFEKIHQGLKNCFQPRNFFEESQIDLMARALFKLNRYEAYEVSAFKDSESYLSADPVNLTISAYALPLALKYKGSIEAQFYRAFDALSEARNPQQLSLFLPEGVSSE